MQWHVGIQSFGGTTCVPDLVLRARSVARIFYEIDHQKPANQESQNGATFVETSLVLLTLLAMIIFTFLGLQTSQVTYLRPMSP